MSRLLNLLLAGIGIILASPLLLASAAVVRLSIGKPILFRQPRPGLGGKPFTMLKFRTMRSVKDEQGEERPDAERLTKVGRFLRASSMDELPELLNVLRGDMNIVGPRPLLVEYLELYDANQARRHSVLPGITGWAQVNGRNTLSWPERLALDVWYVDNRSTLLDLKILWMTISKVLRREGVNQVGQATVERFRGNDV